MMLNSQLYLYLYLFTCYCPLEFVRRKYADISVRTQKGYRSVLYVPKRSWFVTMRDWKGHGEVSPMPIIPIRSNHHTRGSTFHVCNDYTIL